MFTGWTLSTKAWLSLCFCMWLRAPILKKKKKSQMWNVYTTASSISDWREFILASKKSMYGSKMWVKNYFLKKEKRWKKWCLNFGISYVTDSCTRVSTNIASMFCVLFWFLFGKKSFVKLTKVHLIPTLSAAWKAKVKFLLWGKTTESKWNNAAKFKNTQPPRTRFKM